MDAIITCLTESRQRLQRERALEQVRESDLLADEENVTKLEHYALAACSAEAWEERHGAVLASALLIDLRAADASASFRESLLPHLSSLLTDADVRVRQVFAELVEKWARKDAEIWRLFGPRVIEDVKACRIRMTKDKDEIEARWGGAIATVGDQVPHHETEGWGSLETSMRCVSGLMKGIGPSFQLDTELLTLLEECSLHSNRYVREYAYFAISSAASISSSQDWFLPILSRGLRDNWSQVRYASSVAVRMLISNPCFDLDAAATALVPYMCLNRHYVAEGVRLYSQETWRLMVPPTGGAPILMSVLQEVVDAYCAATNAANHAVREAACKCMSELGTKIAGNPEAPTPFRGYFTEALVLKLAHALISAFHDESWPVRDVASTAMAYFVNAFPKEVESHKDELMDLWLWQLGDNIPSLRRNGAHALVMATARYADTYMPVVRTKLPEMLAGIHAQPKDSKTFQQYTPSGPFSVPSKKFASHETYTPDPRVTDKTMYSCGSLAPKTLKEFKDKGGCMNCTVHREEQPWETTEGAVHLMAELCDNFSDNDEAVDIVRTAVPLFCDAFLVDHFPHHVNLKSTMCDVLPRLVKVVGADAFKAIYPKVQEASTQTGHRNLKVLAQQAMETFAA